MEGVDAVEWMSAGSVSPPPSYEDALRSPAPSTDASVRMDHIHSLQAEGGACPIGILSLLFYLSHCVRGRWRYVRFALSRAVDTR